MTVPILTRAWLTTKQEMRHSKITLAVDPANLGAFEPQHQRISARSVYTVSGA